MPISEWRLAAGDSLFGPRLILAVISFWFKATAVVRCCLRETCINILISCHGLRLFGFFLTIILSALVAAVAALCLCGFQSNSSLVVLCSHILFSTIAGSASLGFLLRWWQSGDRKTKKVGRGCGMHEMNWTELHTHGLFCSFGCVANAFYRSSLGWTKKGFSSGCVCWE